MIVSFFFFFISLFSFFFFFFFQAEDGIRDHCVTGVQTCALPILQISARADEVGDNEGEIDATVDGEAAKIAFNSKYLQDVLSALDGAQVALETTNPSSPGVLRPLGSDNYV